MQQLSLFDFGDESPKPEKPKKATKGGVVPSTTAKSKNDAPPSVTPPPTDPPSEKEVLGEDTAQANPEADAIDVAAPELTGDNETTDNQRTAEKESATGQTSESVEASAGIPATARDSTEGDERKDAPSRGTDQVPVAMSLFDDAVSSQKTGDSDRQVVFANEQFAVKLVAKEQKSEQPSIEVTGPEDTTSPDTADPKEDEAAAQTTVDTSFSPEELSMPTTMETDVAADATSPQDATVSALQQSNVTTPPSHIQSEELDTDNQTGPAPLAPPATTDSSADSPEPADTDDVPRKPYYIDQPVVPVKRKRGRKSFKEIDAEVDLISIPPDEVLFQKQYYPISEVAKWFRVNNSLLRFWSNEFKILKPRKNKKGDRFFRPEDVKNLQLIYYLLRQKKLTISGAIKHLKAYREQTEVNLQLIKTLNEFKGFLLELRAATEK